MSIILTDKGRRFGGFTNLPWESPSSSILKANDPQAFIFSLDHKKKLTCHNQYNVMICHSNSGVCFGAGLDIFIKDKFSYSHSYCTSYGEKEGIFDSPFLTGNTGENKTFTPVEVEVYQVMKLQEEYI